MESILFPNWMVFATFFLFLKVYSPTRLFLDNITITALSIVFSIVVNIQGNGTNYDILFIIHAIGFAMFVSIPYWLGGMVGSILQQLLLLNEQSVQDKRFTEESEALARISGLMFVMYALDNGVLFIPIIRLLNGDITWGAGFDASFFKQLYYLIVEYLKLSALVSSKYIIAIISVAICVAMVDLFFKKTSLSSFISLDLKAILLIILLNTWFFSDQLYLFQKMTAGFT